MYHSHLVSDRQAWRQYGFRILALEPRPDLSYATHILCSPHWTPLISSSPRPLSLDSSRPPWFLFLRPHYNALPGLPWRIFSLGLARSCVPGPQTHGCLWLRLSLPLRVSLPGCSQAAGVTLMSPDVSSSWACSVPESHHFREVRVVFGFTDRISHYQVWGISFLH